MKRAISFVLALFLLSSLVLVISAEPIVDTGFISKTLPRNNILTTSEQDLTLRSTRITKDIETLDFITMTITSDMGNLDLSCEYRGEKCETRLVGYAIDVENNQTSYVGVYEGTFPYYSDDMVVKDVPIIADVIFNNEDIFAILTIGEITQYTYPVSLCFGTLTNEIALISSQYAESRMREQDKNLLLREDVMLNNVELASVDTTLAYQAGSRINCGSYVCGRLSVFHGDETANGLTSRVRAKVNTNTTGFLNYLRNEYGYGDAVNQYALSTTPDRITVSISANDAAFYNITYSPTEQQQTFTMTIPVYLGQTLGVQLISIDFISTSIGVTRGYYNSSSPDVNVVNWTFNNSSGWEGTLNGDASSQSGLAVMGAFVYDDAVTNNTTETITSKMTIRYEYYVQTQSTTFALHMTTPTLTVNSAMIVVPG